MEIEFLQLPSGRYPVQDFLTALADKPHKKILRTLEAFDSHPPAYVFNSQQFRKIDGYEKYKMYEFRIAFDRMAYRIIATVRSKCYLVHALAKKRDKIPKRDLELAASRIQNFLP